MKWDERGRRASDPDQGTTKQKSSLRGGSTGLGLLTHLFCPLAFLIECPRRWHLSSCRTHDCPQRIRR